MASIPRPSTPPLICVPATEKQLPSWAKQEFVHLVEQLHLHQERIHQLQLKFSTSTLTSPTLFNHGFNSQVFSPSFPSSSSSSSSSATFSSSEEQHHSFLQTNPNPSTVSPFFPPPPFSSWSSSSSSSLSFASSSPSFSDPSSSFLETKVRYYLHEPKAVMALFMSHDSFQLCMGLQMLPFLQVMFLNEPDFESSQAQHVVRHYLQHPVVCVRLASIQALLTLHRLFGVRYLDHSIYRLFITCLTDNDPQVRKKAIPLARLFGLMYPGYSSVHLSSVIPNSTGASELKMKDISEDVFVRLCDLVNDSHFEIRQCATLELGNFENISTELLLQTLSKKALGVSKKEGLDSMLSKEWKSHAGAFVHAIEDEYQVVRQAALDSISRLGVKHKDFALEAVYFLIDMTNDEMHQIRQNALKVLCQISQAYEVVLTALDLDDLNEVFHDIDPLVRLDLYKFLASIRCSNTVVLNDMIRALRINLNSFKEDISPIFQCVRQIALRNHDFVESEALKLLRINTKFIQREERPDDIHYACKLILVWNAALKKPNLKKYLPKFMLRQISFLTQRYSEAFPPPIWKQFSLLEQHHSEHCLIQHLVKHLTSLTIDTNRDSISEMITEFRQQCPSQPSPHLCFLSDLIDLFLLSHDYSGPGAGSKSISLLQKAFLRIQTVYQIQFHSSVSSSQVRLYLQPAFNTFPSSDLTSSSSTSSSTLAYIIECIRTFPYHSIQHLHQLQLQLDSPLMNSEDKVHLVPTYLPLACELHWSSCLPNLWACCTWPDLSIQWIPLPSSLSKCTLSLNPKSWSDKSSIQITLGQFASNVPSIQLVNNEKRKDLGTVTELYNVASTLLSPTPSDSLDERMFIQLSNPITLWIQYV